jgi:hypothetical protein
VKDLRGIGGAPQGNDPDGNQGSVREDRRVRGRNRRIERYRGRTLKKVYTATDPADAHLLKGLLEGENISAEVRGEYLYGIRGHVQMTPDTCPSVWVVENSDFDRAAELVAAIRGRNVLAPGEAGTWRCGCGEENERQFTECWSCGRSRPSRGQR